MDKTKQETVFSDGFLFYTKFIGELAAGKDPPADPA